MVAKALVRVMCIQLSPADCFCPHIAIVMSVIQVAVASCIGAGSGALADPIFVYGTAEPLHRVNPTLTNIFPQSDQNLYTASEPISVILNYKPRFYGRVGQGFGPGLVTNSIILC